MIRKIGLSCLPLLGFCVPGTSWASAESCNALLQVGITNITSSSSAVDSTAMAMSTFCSADYSLVQSGSQQAIGISGSYGIISGSGSYAHSDSEIKQAQHDLCKGVYNSSHYSSQASSYSKTIYQGALDAWNKCLALASKGIAFEMQPDPTLQSVTVTISANSGATYQFQGVMQTGSGNSTCQTTLPARAGSLSGQVITVDTSTSFPMDAANNRTITCSRNMLKDSQGNLSADGQRLSFNTSYGPYIVDLYPIANLSRLTIDQVTNQVRTALQTNMVPAGMVASFNTTACPAGWTAYTDGQGKFIIGTNGTHPLGQTGGEESHKLTIAEMPSHFHSDDPSILSLNVADNFSTNAQGPQMGSGWGFRLITPGHYGTSSPALQTVAGGDQPHNNMPPFVALTLCQKL